MKKHLMELIEANVIDQETAEKIEQYYRNKGLNSGNRLLLVFAILGALLTGLGIILVIAHNWDLFSRTTKTVFAFIPLVLSQLLSGYVILRRFGSPEWREPAATLLVLSVGASISLVSQIYHIPGDITEFMLTWVLLSLPVVYVMRSSMASLLCIVGITVYGAGKGYFNYPQEVPYYYFAAFSALLPHYFLTLKNRPRSNFTFIHNWLIPLSLIVNLGSVGHHEGYWLHIAYFSLFGLLLLIGNLPVHRQLPWFANGFQIVGFIGSIVMLFGFSTHDTWEALRSILADGFEFNSLEFGVAAIISGAALTMLIHQWHSGMLEGIRLLEPAFIAFIVVFFIGIEFLLGVIIVNIYILAVGIWITREGVKRNHLGILNYGLIIIALLMMLRFFDTNISFVLRGTLFIVVGAGFFITNLWMIRKRNKA